MNRYDSERVYGLLVGRGWNPSFSPDEADLLIVNTCSVREKPAEKLFSFIGRFRKKAENGSLRIFVMGCVAQQLGDEIVKRAPFVSGVFGPGQESAIPDAVEHPTSPLVCTDPASLSATELFPPDYRHTWDGCCAAFVTIMHGCNNHCSYCIVPSVRGTEICRKVDDIIREIVSLVERGVREITLLGQNVTAYHDQETKTDFTHLLYRVGSVPALERIRFVTGHPRDFSVSLAKAFAHIPSLMPYLHLPAQSGSDRILEGMRRGYSVADYLEKISLVRSWCPDISLSSDFIVGFPGETEEDFTATLQLIREARYDTVFAFAYSPRPGTPAAQVAETVSEDEKHDRLHRLLAVQKEIMAVTRNRFVGRTVRVLVEGKSPSGDTMMGRNEHNQIVHIEKSSPADRGRIISVTITERLENTLRGTKIGNAP